MGLVHTQNLRFFYKEKPTCGFGECPLRMEERTLSISSSRPAFDPNATLARQHPTNADTGGRIAFQARPMREAGLFMPTEALPVTKWSLGILHGLVLCSGILDGPNRQPRILIPPDPRSGIPQILDLCSCILDGRTLQCF